MDMQLSQTEGSNFDNSANFAHAQRVAKMLSTSSLIPKEYQGNLQNTMIALEMANRIGASPLMVMQNLNVIQGRPSWSSPFIIAALNSCKRFSPLRFIMSGEGDEYGCTAWATDIETGDKLEGPKVDKRMVTAEGWLNKTGSKWKTMPELMFRYRAAAFFGRLYAPDILMGMLTAEEVVDIQPAKVEEKKEDKERERFIALLNDCATVDQVLHLNNSVKSDMAASVFDEVEARIKAIEDGIQ